NPLVTGCSSGCAVVNPNIPPYPILNQGSNSALSQLGPMTFGVEYKIVEITDGASNTILLGERSLTEPLTVNNGNRSWTRGCTPTSACGSSKNITTAINSTFYNGSSNFNDISMGSNHSGGCNFALADESVKFITQTISMDVYLAAASINTGTQETTKSINNFAP